MIRPKRFENSDRIFSSSITTIDDYASNDYETLGWKKIVVRSGRTSPEGDSQGSRFEKVSKTRSEIDGRGFHS